MSIFDGDEICLFVVLSAVMSRAPLLHARATSSRACSKSCHVSIEQRGDDNPVTGSNHTYHEDITGSVGTGYLTSDRLRAPDIGVSLVCKLYETKHVESMSQVVNV